VDRRQGCLAGLLELLALDWLFRGLERRFGFGRGLSCTGCGCGVILLLIFAALACSVLAGTNWGHLSLNAQGVPLAF
jgi:hypothetical protein